MFSEKFCVHGLILSRIGLSFSATPMTDGLDLVQGKLRERLPHSSTEVIAHHAHQTLGRLGRYRLAFPVD
jgi:hypothetical protein